VRQPLTDDTQTSETGGVSRRSLLAGTAAAVVGAGIARAATSSAGGTTDGDPTDTAYDVIVVGSGAAGFSAALGVLREDPDARVVVLEARPSYGGTSYRSGGRLWVCNNADMRAAGVEDPKEQALAYMARLAHPDDYKPKAHRFGLSKRHYAQLEAYYDNGSDMLDHYRDEGWMPWHAETGVFLPGTADPLGLSGQLAPDYHPEFEENVPGKGRSIMPEFFDVTGTMAGPVGRTTAAGNFGSSIYGPDVIEWLHYSFRTLGGEVHLATRVVDVVVEKTPFGSKKVTGVQTVSVLDGGTVVSEPAPYTELPVKRTYTASRGVIFTTGGYSKSSAKMSAQFSGQKAVSGGGCAVVSAVGDLVDISKKHGFLLENMDQCWFIENIYEQYMVDPNSALSPNYLLFQAYWLAGDSMIVVNRKGVRVVNEKLNYNDRAKVHFQDPDNSFLISVFDEHSYQNFLGLGGQILPASTATIGPCKSPEELQAAVKQHMDQYPSTKAFGLDGSWAATLQDTIETFNGYAESGVDEEFHRGETPIDVWWHAFCLAFHGGGATKDCISANVDENGVPYPNVTMRPLAGDLYAVILSSGMQDTKGGPAVDELGRVLDLDENPVEGLYGAGNCIGSPAGAGYWGAGGTLGPATVFGHLAGRHAAGRKS